LAGVEVYAAAVVAVQPGAVGCECNEERQRFIEHCIVPAKQKPEAQGRVAQIAFKRILLYSLFSTYIIIAHHQSHGGIYHDG